MLSNSTTSGLVGYPFLIPYFIQTDSKGLVLDVCEKFEELLSCLHIQDPIGSPVLTLFSSIADPAPSLMTSIGTEGFPDSFDTHLKNKSSKTDWIRWLSVPVPAKDDRPSGWQLSGIHVETATGNTRKQARANLSSQPEEEILSFDSIINSLPGIFYLVEDTGKILRWNRKLESVSGYSNQEISKMTPLDFFSEEEKIIIQSRTEKIFHEGNSEVEANLLTKEGRSIPYYFTGQLIIYDGKPCSIGMGIDISARRRAEEKIKLSNERYRLATRATNDAIWDWDMKSPSPFWVDGFYTQFGYKPEPEVAVQGFWKSRIHPADQERVLHSISTFIQNKKKDLWSEEYRFQKADGNYAIVSDRCFLVFDDQENVVRAVGSMQDITEKKNLEKKLLEQELNKQKLVAQTMIQAQERERAEIGRELHDNVNQILSTCKLYLELAKSNPKKRMNLMDLSAENIRIAINEIRNISRTLVPRSLGDLGLVASIYDLIENIRASKKIHVEFYTVGILDENINDQQKLILFRIIQEQVNNVVKHSFARNLIIELFSREEDNTIELNIADDGIGFDPETVKLKEGLGLKNILSRADLFNGKVTMVAAPQKGCKLSVQIPMDHL